MNHNTPKFPIPTSLQDLEHPPYNLLPYPNDFDDDNEAARAQSFDRLVEFLNDGTKALTRYGVQLFVTEDCEDDEPWLDTYRMQTLYTLVRKSASLATRTRSNFISALSRTVHQMCHILEQRNNQSTAAKTLPSSFRDAFTCHVYMLFSVMSAVESEIKVGKGLALPTTTLKQKGQNKDRSAASSKEDLVAQTASRAACAKAMLAAAQAMVRHKFQLWNHGVVQEDLLSLPCQISYLILENSTNSITRRASCGDEALAILASTVQLPSMLSPIVASLMDLLHTHEHIAPLVAELCTLEFAANHNPSRLAMELFREIGRMNVVEGKASGSKYVAPFLSELASRNAKLVLAHIGLVLSHLNSESYSFRSSLVTTIGYILTRSDTEEDNSTVPEEMGEFFTDDDESPDHSSCIQKTRESLFDLLTERIHDVSSYTRAAALKAWVHLVENDSIPVERFLSVTTLAIDRLQDKTVIVRKNALQLLTLTLENNVFMGSLNPLLYEKKISELEPYLKSNIPEHIMSDLKSTLTNLEIADDEHNEDFSLETIRTHALQFLLRHEDPDIACGDNKVEYCTKLKAYKFSVLALEFISLFEGANDVFNSLLLSNNSSDVTETVRFFVRARHFDLPCAVTGMKNALSLMWSTEPNIREEVLKGFVDVFLAIPGTNGAELLPEDQIVENLLFLVYNATVSELASIEEAVKLLVKDERIPAEVFLTLWNTVVRDHVGVRASAMLIISMGASANPSIVDSSCRLRILLEACLGEQTEVARDWDTIRSAACALQHIGRVQSSSPEGSAKSIVIEMVVERLCNVARGDWCRDDDLADTNHWFSAAEQAIDAIFVICDEPEKACSDILRGLEAITFGVSSNNPVSVCSELRLSRFFFVVGHIALKLLVYTESLSNAVNKGNAAKSLKKQEGAEKAKTRRKQAIPDDAESAIEKELGVDAEAEAERERKISEISEKEIVGRGLLGLFGQILVRVIDNEDVLFSSDILRQSAALALCKFMCISSEFCEKHLPLLFFTATNEADTNTILQANVAVAMGDLAFRFPNAIEPYTPRIYAFLKDPSRRVRRHTLMVLTHLILNDMVKVKGQVCEIALCLEDSDPRIRDMSRLLFHELSKRSNNPIYNLLPEIISRLSQMEAQKQAFRSIMAFLLSFIKKEKQNEVLVEKICQRFPTCSTISQKAALAFCLANLKANDKCIKILNDSFKFYKDALFDEEVFKCFSSIVSKAKAFTKPEMKELIDEWEMKLKRENADGMENHVAGVKAHQAKEKAAARHAKNVKSDESAVETISSVNNICSESSDHIFDHPEQENKNPTKNIASKNVSMKKTPRKKEKPTSKNTR